MNEAFASEAAVSAATPGPTGLLDVERVAEHRDDVGERRRRPAACALPQPLEGDLGSHRASGATAGGLGVGHGHHAAGADVLKAVRDQALDEVDRRVVDRRRPDVGLAADRREQDQDLGQTSIEGVRVGGPPDGLDPVPERLRLGRVVQEDRVAEVTQLAIRHGVHARLVHEQPAHGRRVHEAVQALAGRVVDAHARTIPAAKPSRWRRRIAERRTVESTSPAAKESPMSRAILTLALSAFMTLALAACGGSSASTAPSTAASAAPARVRAGRRRRLRGDDRSG